MEEFNVKGSSIHLRFLHHIHTGKPVPLVYTVGVHNRMIKVRLHVTLARKFCSPLNELDVKCHVHGM